MKSRKA